MTQAQFQRAQEIISQKRELQEAKMKLRDRIQHYDPEQLFVSIPTGVDRPMHHVSIPMSSVDMIDIMSAHINKQIEKLEFEFEKL